MRLAAGHLCEQQIGEHLEGRPVHLARTAVAQEEHLAQFVNVIVDDIQDSTWSKILPGYRDAKLVLYRDLTPTACSLGRSAAGPFYCPNDQRVYIDLGFYDELRSRFAAS